MKLNLLLALTLSAMGALRAHGAALRHPEGLSLHLVDDEDPENPDVGGRFALLARLNSASPVEPAGSHGSTGMSLGLGAAMTDSAVVGLEDQELGLSGDGDERLVLPRLWLVKGLPLPVDLGFTAMSARDGAYTQAGAHLQWTVYEALALPALAVRASHARLYGLEDTTFETSGGGLAVSWGFLRYLTVYGVADVLHHRGTQTSAAAAPSPGDGYLLAGGATTPLRRYDHWILERAAGLRIVALPPFVNITGEVRLRGADERDLMVKVAAGI